MKVRFIHASCTLVLLFCFGCRSSEAGANKKQVQTVERIARKWMREQQLGVYADYPLTIHKLNDDEWAVGVDLKKFEFGIVISWKSGRVVRVTPSG